MKWYVNISGIRGALIEQAKVEALRRIAEELEKQRILLEDISERLMEK